VTDPIHVRGAVDLGALAAAREAQQRASNAPAGSGVVIDVTEATFQTQVIERSMTVPVIIDLWADWCQPCKTLTPILESMALQDGGRWVLAKVDTEAEQRIAAAFQVQSIPSTFAVIKGQPLPLFQGALPAAQVRQYLDAVLAEAAKAGVAGVVEPAAGPANEEGPVEPPVDPDLEAAYTAMESADWEAATAAFQRLLARDPGDESAQVGLATAGLYARVDGADPAGVLAAAQSAPADVAKQSLAADVEIANGDAVAAFARMIDCVRVTAGDERAAARTHLLALFEVVGPADPTVVKARIALANALF
jgi:putative thioredoxin